MSNTERLTAEQIYELGKKEVSYDRQLAVLGKKDADAVLYFWMEGYNFRDQETQALQREYGRVEKRFDECYGGYELLKKDYESLKVIANKMFLMLDKYKVEAKDYKEALSEYAELTKQPSNPSR